MKKTTEAVDHAGRLRDVLSAMGIKRGTFVDDQFSPKFDDVWAGSRAVVATKGKELVAAWCSGRWEADSAEDDKVIAQAKWDGLGRAARVELTKAIAVLTTGERLATDVSFFSTSWPSETCPLEEIGPEDFSEAYIAETLIGKGPSILFMDLNFETENDRGGLQLLKKVLGADREHATVCVVFTQRSGAEGVDYWAELAAESGISSRAAVVISKSAARSLPAFEVELRRALLNSLAPEFATWANGIAKEALAKALVATQIEGDVLNAVVLQSSEKEGVHPSETLFRLIDEEFRRERDNLVVAAQARAGFTTLKTKLEAIAKIAPKGDVELPLSLRVRKLRRGHLYRDQVGPREWPSPMWLGDLWEVKLEGSDEAEQFVLIAQPCDIILRADNGKRSQEWAILAPLRPAAGKHPESVVELKYFDELRYESRWVALKKARVANANVLDVAATLGQTIRRAELANLRARSHVHASMEKRTVQLVDWLENMFVDANAANGLALFSGPGPAAKLSTTGEAITFHCKRVGRIEPELARLVLQRYGNFVSRPALPHDFADYEK